MDISKIWMSQRNLQRAEQIPAMVEAIKTGKCMPRITILLCEDGELQIQDGHHRLVSIWLSGRTELKNHEYVMLDHDQFRVRCGKIDQLLKPYSEQA